MEVISSRKNQYIHYLRQLQSDSALRDTNREFVCEGKKLLDEAVDNGAKIKTVLMRQNSASIQKLQDSKLYCATDEVYNYASTMVDCPGPLFTVEYLGFEPEKVKNAVVLEDVQDPGNVGTVIRTANAFGIDLVILTGQCADLHNPKTVRATMGAVFRQAVIKMDIDELKDYLDICNMPLYGAALSDRALDIRSLSDYRGAYAVGNEGKGLTDKLLSLCDSQVIIPMNPASESLNAAVAASVIMWIVSGQEL